MSDRLRWRIAHLADRLPFMCWANLVSWALRYDDYTLRGCVQDWMCRADLERNGSCYCNKLTANAARGEVPE